MSARWQNVVSIVALVAALAINAWPTGSSTSRTQVAQAGAAASAK